jgi:beta-glucosidase
VDVSKHDEEDTYLPAFRATVTEGKAGSVMCAYNSINGQPACANEFLLQDHCAASGASRATSSRTAARCSTSSTATTSSRRSRRPRPSASSAAWTTSASTSSFKVKDDHDYKPYLDAVKAGLLKESDIDTAVTRLFTARMKLGMFDPPEMVPYTKIDEKLLDSAEHRAMARKLANESMVLLKNDGVLPLKTSASRSPSSVPLADQTKVLLGNYNGTPTHTVSFSKG